MKKIILFAALAVSAMSAQAVVTVEGSKFSDNWSVTLKGGAVSRWKGHGFWENARGIFGAELRKQITPTFGLGVEGEWTVNTSSWAAGQEFDGTVLTKSPTGIDHHYVGVFGTLNLMNVFAGYAGSPRVFEIEAIAGTGWLHAYDHGCRCIKGNGNSWGTKAGLNLNFNLGSAKAWTLSLKPAVLWNMNNNFIPETKLGYSAQYNAGRAFVEMEAGLTYHFKNSNGTHSFKVAELMDINLLNSLRAQNESLAAQLDAANAANAAAMSEIDMLRKQLEECRNRVVAPAPSKSTLELVQEIFGDNYYKRYIFFDINSDAISHLQQPELYLVAELLKAHPEYSVNVKGYASPDGGPAINNPLSLRRAKAVATSLEKYLKDLGLPTSKITNVEGLGAELLPALNNVELKGNAINQWNRVAVVDINF